MASVGRSLLLVTRDGAQRNSRSARLEAIASSVKACGAATLRAVGRENRAASDCSAILAKYYQNLTESLPLDAANSPTEGEFSTIYT